MQHGLLKIVNAHELRRMQLLMAGFVHWSFLIQLRHLERVPIQQTQATDAVVSRPPSEPRARLHVALSCLARHRGLHRGFARWVEYTMYSTGQRLWRLEQERLARQCAEHEIVVGSLKAQLGEARTECSALEAKGAMLRDSTLHGRDSLEALRLRDTMRRVGAKAIVRIVSSQERRCLLWGHTQWRMQAVMLKCAKAKERTPPRRSPSARSISVPREHSRDHADILARAAERVSRVHETENRSPTLSTFSSGSRVEQSKPLQKAIHLRQRLQEHIPRASTGVARDLGRGSTKGQEDSTHNTSKDVGKDIGKGTGKEVGQSSTMKSGSKKGALLRGLRMRLEQ